MEKYLLPNYKRFCNLVVVYPNNLNSLNVYLKRMKNYFLTKNAMIDPRLLSCIIIIII